MREPAFDTDGNPRFDLKVHHAAKDGTVAKVTPYQLSIYHGHHFYFADGRVYRDNNNEVPFHEIPADLKRQWKILSPEDQQRAILRSKISARKKVESDIKAAQEELLRLTKEEKEESALIAKQQAAAKKQAEQEEKELDEEFKRAQQVDKENEGSKEAGSFGKTMAGGSPDDDGVV